VAGWWTVDEPWESIAPWIRYEHDDGRIIAAAGTIDVLLSDNDPFTADSVANAALWWARLRARVRLVLCSSTEKLTTVMAQKLTTSSLSLTLVS
jgi:sugar/nucleoside kinase (ribokinase family)